MRDRGERNDAGKGVPPVRRLGDCDRALPVAFLHGYLASPALWAASGAHRPGIALALPGHHPWSLDAVAIEPWLDLDRLAEGYARALAHHFGDRPAVLVGHSTGGLLALHVARRYPERIDSVLLTGAFGSGRLDVRPNLVAWLVARPVLGPFAARALMAGWLASDWTFRRGLRSATGAGVVGRSVSKAMHADLRASDVAALRRFGLWLRTLDITDGLDAIARPVRWLIGRTDPVIEPRRQLRVLRRLPNADAVVLDAGHLPMTETPASFDAVLDRWVAARAWRGVLEPRFDAPRSVPAGSKGAA